VKAFRRNNSGQALLELALMMPMLLIFVLGIVDFTRAVYDYEVITNLSGEGSSAASRGNALQATANTIMTYAGNDINMNTNGCVVLTTVNSPSAGSYKVTGQAISSTCNTATSRIGCAPPASGCGNATVPLQVQQVLQNSPSQTVYITEVFYKFTAITPIGFFLHNSNLLPSQLYSASYY
jgi:Flp pilus assembly protein TadG